MKRTRAALVAHVGGAPSATQRALIERALQLTLRIDAMDFRFLAEGGMTEHDSRTYLAWSASLARVLKQIGLKGAATRAPICVHGDVALAPDDPLAAVETTHVGERRLHRLAVEHAARGTGLTAHRLAVKHQSDIVDRAEQQAPDETPEPPVDGLPRPEVHRQHPPAARAACHVADRVQHLAQVNSGPVASP